MYYRNCEVEKELSQIKSFVETKARQNLSDKFQEFKSPIVRKSLFLVILMFASPHLSGMINIMSYMEIILDNAKSYLIEPKAFVIYANIIGITSVFSTVRLIDKLGRRILLVASSIGTAVAMVGLGIHFH